jgi:uncharacterized integral membrane protein
VELKFFFWSFQSRRILVIAFSCIVGVMIGWMMAYYHLRKHQ